MKIRHYSIMCALSILSSLGVLAPPVWAQTRQIDFTPSSASNQTAGTRQIDFTLRSENNQTFTALMQQAEVLAKSLIERGFAESPDTTELSVNILGERDGQEVPLLFSRVSRSDWQKQPIIRQWTRYLSSSAVLLGFKKPQVQQSNSPVYRGTSTQPPTVPPSSGTSTQPPTSPASSGTSIQPPTSPASPGNSTQPPTSPASPGTSAQPPTSPASPGTFTQVLLHSRLLHQHHQVLLHSRLLHHHQVLLHSRLLHHHQVLLHGRLLHHHHQVLLYRVEPASKKMILVIGSVIQPRLFPSKNSLECV